MLLVQKEYFSLLVNNISSISLDSSESNATSWVYATCTEKVWRFDRFIPDEQTPMSPKRKPGKKIKPKKKSK